MKRFSEKTEKVLRQAGWYPGRSVDTSPAAAYFREDGYMVTPPILAFLQEFGDLRIAHRGMYSGYVLFHFNVIHAWPGHLEPFVEHICKPLCPIGATANSVWVMDPEGGVYDTDFNYLNQLGRSGDEALENAIHKDKEKIIRLLTLRG